MTTIKDYARDLVTETIAKIQAEYGNDKIELTPDEIEDLVNDFIDSIKNRIVGE